MTHPFLTIGCWMLTLFNVVLVVAGVEAWRHGTSHWYTCLLFIVGFCFNALFSWVAAESFANCDHNHGEEEDGETDEY